VKELKVSFKENSEESIQALKLEITLEPDFLRQEST